MNTQEHHFQLPTLSCGHCVASVTRALQALGAEVEVEADLPSRSITVEAPVRLDRERLAQALREAGYPPA